MKKKLTALLAACLLVQPVGAFAAPPDYSGGVKNEYRYEEYVFLSGEPVKFTGTCAVTERVKGDDKTVRYTFSLTPEDKSVTGRLSRNVSYVISSTKRNDKGQTIEQTSLERITESVTINDLRFALEDYQFSKSDVVDNRPVSDFYSGNIKARKHYIINSGQGTATVDISGGDVGYANFWGQTDTQILDYVISVERYDGGDEEGDDLSWYGTVRIQASDSITKELKYEQNEANYSSFQGGILRVTNQEMVSVYDYSLPRIRNGMPSSSRNNGTVKLSQTMVPRLERLIIPKFRDTSGHWAEDDINKLYSMDVFDETAQFFLPNIAMTRAEFTKAVMRACDIRPQMQEKSRTTTRNKVAEVSVFKDVDIGDPDYEYIKEAVAKGIISGESKDYFRPGNPLTRAEAVAILIRALGFEGNAPTPGYYTMFSDDREIPSWARDSIYVAKETGLITGDEYNRANPEKVLTRAEASALLVNFLNFLEKDLQKDYRENIILF